MSELDLSKELKREFAAAFTEDSDKRLVELTEAAEHFDKGHYGEAQRILEPLLKQGAGHIAELQELLGLCYYRREYYKKAIRHLEEFSQMTASIEQYPVLADCYRATGDFKKAEKLWQELNRAFDRNKTADSGKATESKGALRAKGDKLKVSGKKLNENLQIEGRIVQAGTLLDQGKNEEAVNLLSEAVGNENRLPKSPNQGQIRQTYVLADIYEQSGLFTKAKHLFEWVAKKDATNSTDASERLIF